MRKTEASCKTNSTAKNKSSLYPLITSAEIQKSVKKIARRIDKDYKGNNPLLAVTLKGSFLFAADLLKAIKTDTGLSFLRASSYSSGTRPAKKPKILYADNSEFRGRHIILIEDIIDRGITLEAITAHIKKFRPASISICALLLRGPAMKKKVRYYGKIIGRGFAVGYGLDYKDKYRGLNGIYVLQNEKKE